MTRDEIDARNEASRLRKDAEESAAKILADARAEASNVATVAAKEAAQAEQAKLAAQLLALRAREQAFDESGVDRAVELARVLAERLVGEALTLDATTVAKLARQALLEGSRGARTVHIEANPEDVATLQEHLSRLTKTHVASRDRGTLRSRAALCACAPTSVPSMPTSHLSSTDSPPRSETPSAEPEEEESSRRFHR